MRCECQRGCGAEVGWDFGPGGIQEVVAASQAGVQGLQEAALAVEAVGEVLVELRGRVPDVWAVARAQHGKVELAQPVEGVQIGGQGALARGDEDAACPEDGVTREADTSEEQADAVGGVPGRNNRCEGTDLRGVIGEDDRRTEEMCPLGMIRVRVRKGNPLNAAVSRAPNGLEVDRISRPRVHHP